MSERERKRLEKGRRRHTAFLRQPDNLSPLSSFHTVSSLRLYTSTLTQSLTTPSTHTLAFNSISSPPSTNNNQPTNCRQTMTMAHHGTPQWETDILGLFVQRDRHEKAFTNMVESCTFSFPLPLPFIPPFPIPCLHLCESHKKKRNLTAGL